MTRWLFLFLLFVACNPLTRRETTGSIVLIADVQTNIEPFSGIKFNAKVFKSSDSVRVSLSSFMGLEVARLVIKKNTIIIYNQFVQSKQILPTSIMGRNFNIEKLVLLASQKKIKQETITMAINETNFSFTDYRKINIDNKKRKKHIFLPQNIIIKNENLSLPVRGGIISIDYKSIADNRL